MITQSELIGHHPDNTDIFATWLNCTDIPVTDTKNHRSLTAIDNNHTNELIEWLGRRIFDHHHSEDRVCRLKAKLKEIGYEKYASQYRNFPINVKTQRGNATEIILLEYVKNCLKKQLIHAYRLRYNPNADQAMKGDDVLLVDYLEDKQKVRVYLGEAKFRGTPDKAVIDQICQALSKDKKPLSYTFLVDRLVDARKDDLANLLETFIIDEIKNDGDLVYAGLILSTRKSHDAVERHMKSDNSAFVLISIGIDSPTELIDKAFQKAEYFLNHPDEL